MNTGSGREVCVARFEGGTRPGVIGQSQLQRIYDYDDGSDDDNTTLCIVILSSVQKLNIICKLQYQLTM